MNEAAAPIHPALAWFVSLLVPVALVIVAVRLAMTPAFLAFEYRTPNFPPDTYGFTLEDRMYWGTIAINTLVELRAVDDVRAQRFEDGTSVYNERELGHWEDVINLWRSASRVGYGALFLLVGLGIWAWRTGWLVSYKASIGRGGLLTLSLMGVIIVFVAVAFGVLFVGFHQIFFPPGTWQFFYSDTFIRLFPERFWRDIFLAVGGMSVGFGLLLWYFFVKRSAKSDLAR
jgi:integral membrane protein (TIGR01906 family)